MSDRPNILYFMTDQHRADWLGCAGHQVVKTPNIDSIATKGTRFTNFYVTTPVCMPNRGAIFTGRYPSVNGLRHNGLPLPGAANTFVDLLRDAGYHTASIGKSHLQPFLDTSFSREDEPHIANEAIPEAWKSDDFDYGNEQPSNYSGAEDREFPQPYYGFDHVRMVTHHSDVCGGHYLQWLRRQNDDWASLRDRKNQLPHDYTCPQAFRTPLPEDLYPTAFIRDEAKQYLDDRKSESDPFFAFVSFPDPHHPFTPPGKYWDMYSPDDFEVDLPFEAHKNPLPQLRVWKEMHAQGRTPKASQMAFAASDEEIRQAMALSAGMIAMIDDAIGKILARLAENGQDRDTIIIFNSDHGDFMGAFSMLLKGPYPHVSVNKVPFIWSDPTQANVPLAEGLAASLDIGATILERCGVTPYHGMQGKSFLGQTQGDAGARENVLIEHEENKLCAGFQRRPNIRTLVTDTHRLSVYKGLDWGELYDLRSDPNETHNIWDQTDTRATRDTMMLSLTHMMMEAVDPSPWPTRLA